MSDLTAKKQTVDETRIGECAAMQPLSGVKRVDESGSVNGYGHGAFVRLEEVGKDGKRR